MLYTKYSIDFFQYLSRVGVKGARQQKAEKHNGLLPMQIILDHVDKEIYHWMTGVFSFS